MTGTIGGDNDVLTELRLGNMRYALARRLLLDEQGTPVHLRPQSLLVLDVLARNAARVVSKDALIDEVWPGLNVSDDSLTQCVADIRRALGDAARTLLRTLPKQGYRLDAQTAGPFALAAAAPSPPATHVLPTPQAPPAAPEDWDIKPVIAVLPLGPRGPRSDAEDATMGQLIADDLISALSHSGALNVITAMSTRTARVLDMDLQRVATELKANFVVRGNCSMDGGVLRLSLELTDVSTGLVLWTDRCQTTVDAIVEDINQINDFARRILHAIALQETRKSRRFPINSLRNYTLLTSAITLTHRLSEKDFMRAREMLHLLEQRCPMIPEPLAWIGRWHVLRVQQGWSRDLRAESDLALSYTRRALEIDPDNALSLGSEGAVLVNLAHDLDQAEYSYSLALDSNPSDAYCRLLRGTLYAFQGRGAAARKDCEHSLRLAPMDPHRFLYLALTAGANIAAQDYDRAIELAEESYRLNRSHASTLRVMAVANWQAGRRDEARQAGAALLRLQPDLRVSEWLNRSPSRNYEIGQVFAEALCHAGVPN